MPRTRSLAWSELKIGIIAVVAIALAVMLIVAVGGQGGFSWQQYELKTRFPDVKGLKSGAVVRVAGVEVGKVADVQLSGSEVEVILQVNEENKPRITTESRASIGSLSLLGEPVIDISPSTKGTPLNDALGDLQATTRRISAGEGSLGRLLKDDALAKSLTSASANFDQVTARLNRGDNTMGRLLTERELYDRFNSLTGRLDTLIATVEKGEGSAGQLLRDKQLYENMNGAATELRQLIGEIRKDPRKYLNVRVSIF
jgi:phospholipid/cholesterol/gamma-HCH transport system substrate-binding protein